MYKARSDEEPHIFSVVDRAWQDMLHHKEHQNIILSGDRNSGKSFNFTQMIRHLCFMAKVKILLHKFGPAAADVMFCNKG